MPSPGFAGMFANSLNERVVNRGQIPPGHLKHKALSTPFQKTFNNPRTTLLLIYLTSKSATCLPEENYCRERPFFAIMI